MLKKILNSKFVKKIQDREDMRAVFKALNARMQFPYPDRINEVHIDEAGKTIPGIIVWNSATLVQDFPNLFILGFFVIILGTIFPYL